MEDIINNEVEEFSAFLLDESKKADDNAIDVQNVYNISILNALWRIISGNPNKIKKKKKFTLEHDMTWAWHTFFLIFFH